ncbi:amiloride-sensitive sodium channel subunit alpha-like [Mizuhopecten yessoensis]|uniref:Amiloride-sensitive sodium channel subunit alpha n=1 Tax=Mizuhopecten yessoensis TaxID=6573 RepID=A0A210Q7P5_MIZYE|nr:amiloride-sensitive sodium channel subunit alpha-like [Mizuhopecten yessoensis]OWF44768.1 Amiloride-sensitive sodium channel subunit alpha [Mizuhopecten yessoensis]
MSDNGENGVKTKSIRRVFSRFSEKTTMHAAPYINSATYITAKVIWAFLLVAGIAAMTLHLYYLINNFLSWPKKTTLTLGFSNLELPAVTICNVNPIRNSQLHNTNIRLQRLVEKVDPDNFYLRRRKRFLDAFDNQNLSYYDDETDYDEIQEELERQNLEDYDEFEGVRDAIAEINHRFTELYMDEDIGVREDIGHDIHAMLIRCSFGQFSCFPENFTLHRSQHYGNCYTLDAKKMIVKDSGPALGLTLMLYMENHEYLAGITDGYGARVHIHAKDTVPFPYQSGFFVQTGQETTIALKQTKIERITKPHGNCATSQEFKDLYKKVYTRQSCVYLCRPTQIVKQCGCYDDYDADLFQGSSKRICTSRQDYECVYRVTYDIINKKITCTCTDPCVEDDYDLEISSREWPTNKYSFLIREAICEDSPVDCDILRNYTIENLRRNFVKLVIYYKQLNYQSLKEEADIENAQFASDVGGAIGLWIGLSILSIFEIIQLIVELVGYCLYRNEKLNEETRRRQRNDPTYRRKNGNSRYNDRPVHYVTNSRDHDDRYGPPPSWNSSKDIPEVRIYKGRRSSYGGSSNGDAQYSRPTY